jgi:hypothetical protein
VEIDAATIGHDLQRGQSRFTRVTRRPRVPAGEETGAAAEQATDSSGIPAGIPSGGNDSGGSHLGSPENGRVTADMA